MNLDLENLSDEQKAQIEEALYKAANYNTSKDADNFVIPFIAMNDGVTPAQIRTSSRGLYKDIQRSPFLRRTGVFDSNNTIPDIDISSLVYYGTLEQSKIAPTLENVDIKLYFREPKLTKVPDNDGNTTSDSYADNYIWRELPSGFHTYNNDTVYGYEWLVLQDDYVNTNGVYNLHMNVEDGLGCCKFAGTQAPINLAGVQYKIIITAKNLWNREYSLIDSMPLVHNLGAESDDLAPTVNAVREYYENALDTLKVTTEALYAGNDDDFVLTATEDGVTIKSLTLGEIENLENYVTSLNDDFYSHIKETVDGATYDSNGNLIGVHGIINKGRIGNIAASTLDGLTLSNGQQSVVEDVTGKYAYIPYVDNNNIIGLGSTINFYNRSGNEDPSLYLKKSLAKQTKTNTLIISNVSGQSDLTDILETISVGTTILNARVSTIGSDVTLSFTSGSTENNGVTLSSDKIKTNLITLAGETINAANVAVWKGSSSIAYKIPYSELLNIDVKSAGYKVLTPNISTDADGNKVTNVDTTKYTDDSLMVPKSESEEDVNADISTFDKLGSALQALYELPLGTYKYKRGQDEYKTQIGIFVERVNQIRDNLSKLKGNGTNSDGTANTTNYVVHKRNTLLKSSNTKIKGYDEGLDASQDRKDSNVYTYTDEEIKSIAHYLDLTTSKKELAQEIRNTVGILLIAAKETQERLLDVETAVYGFDAKTVPGDDEAKENWVNDHIEKDLQSQITNNPLLLGLNRLMRALCLEIFDTTDLEQIDAEYESRLTDSDTLGEKVSIKSRMDQIDEITSSAANQLSAVVKYYVENITNDENSHSYVDIYNYDGTTQRISSEASTTEDSSVLSGIWDNHSELTDIDKGRTWKNLPADEDISYDSKAKVGFAKIADSAHKHTPSVEESGTVRVPVVSDIERTDISETKKDSEETESTNRSWTFFKLDSSTDDENYYSKGSYEPLFKTKAVAWNSAKLERINKKVSELTKTVYGIDDVTMSLPNRTEVLRRNITNLIDDLYPNRLFRIENPVTVSNGLINETLYYPFKNSKIQNPIANEDNTYTTAVSNTEDEDIITSHTSLITWFDNEIFNFTIKNNYVANNGAVIDQTAGVSDKNNTLVTHVTLKSSTDQPFDSNSQIKLSEDQINFETSKLISDTTDVTGFGTYQHAYSRLDLLEDLIGVEDCYIDNIYSSNILDAFGINKENYWLIDYLPNLNNLAENAKVLSEAIAKYTNSDTVDNLYTFITNDSYTTTDGTIVSQSNIRYASSANPTLTTYEYNATTKEIEAKTSTYTGTQCIGTGTLDILNRALNAEKTKLFDTQKEKNETELKLKELNSELKNEQDELATVTANRITQQSAVDTAQTNATIAYQAEQSALENFYEAEKAKESLEETTIPACAKDLNTKYTTLDSKNTAYNTAVTNQRTAQDVFDSAVAESNTIKAENDKDLAALQTATSAESVAQSNYTNATDSSTGESYCRSNDSTCNTTYTNWQNADNFDKTLITGQVPLLTWYSYIIWYINSLVVSITLNTNQISKSWYEKYDDNNYLYIETYGTRNSAYKNNRYPSYGTYYYFDYLFRVSGKIAGSTFATCLSYAGNSTSYTEWADRQENNSSRTYAVLIKNFSNGSVLENTVNTARNSIMNSVNSYLSTYFTGGVTSATTVPTISNLDWGLSPTSTSLAPNVYDSSSSIANSWNNKLTAFVTQIKTYYDSALKSYRTSLSDELTAATATRKAAQAAYDASTAKLKTAIANVQAKLSTLNTCKSTTKTAISNLQSAASEYNSSLTSLNIYISQLNSLIGTSKVYEYIEDSTKTILPNQTNYYVPITNTTNIKNPDTTSSLILNPYSSYYRTNGVNTYIKSQLTTLPGGTIDELYTKVVEAIDAHKSAENILTTATATLNSLKATELNYTNVIIPNLQNQIADVQNTIYSIENSIDLLEASIDNLDSQVKYYTQIVNSLQQQLDTIQSVADDTTQSNDSNIIPSYVDELQFTNYVKELEYTNSINYNDVVAPNLQISSNVGFILSRKEKTLQERITTLEAYADELSKGFNYINNSTLYTNVKTIDKKKENRRFEALDAFDTLAYIGESLGTEDKNPMVFDLDLSESYANNGLSLYSHNVNLWQIITHSDNVRKSVYTTTSTDDSILGSYIIKGTLQVPLERISFFVDAQGDVNNDNVVTIDDIIKYFEGSIIEGSEWQINVKYVKSGTSVEDLTDVTSIYVLGKTPTTAYYDAFITNNDFDKTTSIILNGSNGWQNQTEYNVYKTINNLFTSLLTKNLDSEQSLYYQLMLLEHPVGSVYMSMNSTDPSQLFGGTWKQLTEGYLLPSKTSYDVTNLNEYKPTEATQFTINVTNHDSNGLLEGYEGSVSLKGLTVYDTYSSTVNNNMKSTYNVTSIEANNEVLVTATGNTTLTINNIPHINVCVWVRIN